MTKIPYRKGVSFQERKDMEEDGVFMENPTSEDVKRETMDMLKRVKIEGEKKIKGENITIREHGDGFDIILEKSKVVFTVTDTGEIVKPSD